MKPPPCGTLKLPRVVNVEGQENRGGNFYFYKIDNSVFVGLSSNGGGTSDVDGTSPNGINPKGTDLSAYELSSVTNTMISGSFMTGFLNGSEKNILTLSNDSYNNDVKLSGRQSVSSSNLSVTKVVTSNFLQNSVTINGVAYNSTMYPSVNKVSTFGSFVQVTGIVLSGYYPKSNLSGVPGSWSTVQVYLLLTIDNLASCSTSVNSNVDVYLKNLECYSE